MEKLKKFLDITSIVTLRKTEYFNRIWHQFSKIVPNDINQNEVKQVIQKAIANLDNNLFISKQEKLQKIVDSSLQLANLALDENDIKRNLEIEIKQLLEQKNTKVNQNKR